MDNFVYWCLKYPIALFVLPLALCVIAFIVMLVALPLNKLKLFNASLCFLLWMTAPFFVPFTAARTKVIKKSWLAFLLIFVSPAALAAYFIVFSEVFDISPFRYKDLKFTSRDDIICVTGLSAFPDYEYHSNSYDSWSGTLTVRFVFKDVPTASFYEELATLKKQPDNLYWSGDALMDDYDYKFFDSDSIYIYSHGWDGKYIPAPAKDMPESVDLSIFIGKRGFVCRYKENANLSLDIYGNRDSISARTGVQFPTYKNVNCKYMDIGPDWGEDWFMLLDDKPSKEFIRQIKASPDWKPLENRPGCYEYSKTIEYKSTESIVIDENSRVVKANYGTL